MISPKITYSSARSQKARIAVRLADGWITILKVLLAVVLIGGLASLVLGLAFGWLVLGLAAIPAMTLVWYKGELKKLPPVKNPKTIDDVLSVEVLGRLPYNPSPIDMVGALSTVVGGQFFATRLGVSSRFLHDIVSADKSQSEVVLQSAVQLAQRVGIDTISAPVLMAALARNANHAEALLAHLQLDFDDLEQGAKWYKHLLSVVEYRQPKHRPGGLARDWSFGWTPLLNRFATNVSHMDDGKTLEIKSRKDVVDRMTNTLTTQARKNVALVGSPSVGKTEIVKAFAARLLNPDDSVPKDLKFNQVFILDASALISAASGRGELEHVVPMILNEAYRAKNTVVCLDDAQLFFQEGVGAVDLSNVLMPAIDAGGLRLILTMDEQHMLKVASKYPALATKLNRINVEQTSPEDTMAIMQDEIIIFEYTNKVTYMYQALKEAYRLSERYIYDMSMPGKAIKLLEAAAQYAENGLVTARSVQMAIENTMGVKAGVASSSDEKDTLLNMEELIHERMINQTRAVSAVSDALRRARAGVRNQNRPIGTFLFLGPTGVGKSELAKALASVYFEGEQNIIRIDMNEYVTNADVARLIADGTEDSNSLTARALKQPFSVVLLDEIEKAHPNVMNTLLQMLDEGVLRDTKNREVSFRDAIIIATSNAGADRIREYIDRGHDIDEFEDQFVDEIISSGQFKPEFLNRFDEIVVFKPLKKAELLQVVDKFLEGVNKTLAQQKISVRVADDAKEYLVEAGYDPRLGARPMRRIVQKAVESVVAKQVLAGEVAAGGVVEISLDKVKLIVEIRAKAEEFIDGNEQNKKLE